MEPRPISRRDALRLMTGAAATAGVAGMGVGYSLGSQPSADRATPTPIADTRPTRQPVATTVPQAPTLTSECTIIEPGEGALSAASRSSGKGQIDAVSITSKATGTSKKYTMDELNTTDDVVHPGDTLCVEQKASGTAVAVRTPERAGERKTKNPTVFNQREFREGNDICGPTTLASVFTTYGIPGQTPDVVREELRTKKMYEPSKGTTFRNSGEPNDVVRWLQKEKNFSVRSIVDIQGKGGAPRLNNEDLKLLQSLCEQDFALIASGMIPLEELGRADHILWINEANPETGQIKVVDSWMGKHEWRDAATAFQPLFYIHAVKPN